MFTFNQLTRYNNIAKKLKAYNMINISGNDTEVVVTIDYAPVRTYTFNNAEKLIGFLTGWHLAMRNQ